MRYYSHVWLKCFIVNPSLSRVIKFIIDSKSYLNHELHSGLHSLIRIMSFTVNLRVLPESSVPKWTSEYSLSHELHSGPKQSSLTHTYHSGPYNLASHMHFTMDLTVLLTHKLHSIPHNLAWLSSTTGDLIVFLTHVLDNGPHSIVSFIGIPGTVMSSLSWFKHTLSTNSFRCV